jgi:cellulose synthase/poly-beta-1,6-N-acetylglucosamine synthase-like glycosyltransferase
LNWRNWIRQAHRWLSIVFTFIVLAIFGAQGLGTELAEWVFFLPLFPLLFMLLTGLYLFALPYISRPHGKLTK